MSEQERKKWATVLTTVGILGVVAIIVLVLLGLLDTSCPLVVWAIIAGAMLFLLVGLGFGATGKWYGAIVEAKRNRASLSRLQIALWTVMIISAYMTIAFIRSKPNALKVASPEEIAACKAEYVAEHYGINLADLKDEEGAKAAEEASEAMSDGQDALEEANKELAEGVKALEQAVTAAESGDTAQILGELDDLQDAVSEVQEELGTADEAMTEAQEELDVQQEAEPSSEEPVALEEALAEAEDECAVAQPLKIRFPPELLMVLGISTASLAGSTLIKSNKRGKTARRELVLTRLREAEDKKNDKEDAWLKANANAGDLLSEKVEAEALSKDQPDDEGAKNRAERSADEYEGALEALSTAESEKALAEGKLAKVERELEDIDAADGLLAVAKEPKFSDIFYGDETGNVNSVALDKVQMFFFTIAILLAYGVAIGTLLQQADLLINPLGFDFPALSSSMVTLLGISHAGYLTVKSADKTKKEELQ